MPFAFAQMSFKEAAIGEALKGIVEVDEIYIGGLEKNKHNKKKLKIVRDAVGKMMVKPLPIRH